MTSSCIAVRVRLFAGLREACGASEMTLNLRDGATVENLLEHFYEIHPASRVYATSLSVVVNGRFADSETQLHTNDEVGLLPPVGGG